MRKFLFLLAFALIPFSNLYADYKVATIDIAKVIQESREAKAERERIEKKAKALQEKMNAKKEKLKSEEEALRKKGVDRLSAEADGLRSRVRDFEREIRDAEDALKKEAIKFDKEFSEKVGGVIAQYAKDNKIDLVLNAGELGRSTVIYRTRGVDITEDIIGKLN